MANIISLSNASLPRSLDVSITLSKPQTESTTDFSVPVFVQSSGTKDFGAARISFYSTYQAVADDATVSANGLLAARDFFAQPKRAATMAIAQAFTAAQFGYVKTGATTATLVAWQAVTNGSFAITINGTSNDVTGVNFSAATTLANVASILQTAIRAEVGAGFTAALVAYDAGTTQFKITSGVAGDASIVSVLAPTAPLVGTDISGTGFLNGRSGVAVTQAGYLPTGISGELDLIATAAKAGGKFVYGWALDSTYRDTPDQVTAAQWAQARTAVMPVVSNSPLAWDAASTTDLGPQIETLGLYRGWPIYHDKAAYFPDMAMLALMLSVDYAQYRSTITAKFKDLVGIPLVNLTETQWSVLQSKSYNTFTLTGNQARVFREGGTGNPAWFADDVVNLDNYVEELQVAVYNVFLRNGKVPYSTVGQAMLQDAITAICERYIYNGTLAERRVLDITETTGYRDDPAYNITPTPIEQMSAADRGARVGPPFVVDLNLAGAIHSIAIGVNAYS
jgi:hypothetical protein